MKNLFEHMVTAMVMIFMMFAFTSVLYGEMQIVNARRVYNSVVNTIQASYYTVDTGAMREKIQDTFGDGWDLTVTEATSFDSRRSYHVRLDYRVDVPIFGISKDGSIEGYAQ